MTAASTSGPGTLTPGESARLAELTAEVLAAPSPKQAMQEALASLMDREQLPAVAAPLFEAVVWRADLSAYWIYFRMAAIYAELGPSREDACFLMASLALQLDPESEGADRLYGYLFAILRRRGEMRVAAEVFIAAAALTPERPPAGPAEARAVFEAAGLPLPWAGRAPPGPPVRRNHPVVPASIRPAWDFPVIGGAVPFTLRPLRGKSPRRAIDVAELHDAEVLLSNDRFAVIGSDGALHADLSVSDYPELIRAKFDTLAAGGKPVPDIVADEAIVIGDRYPLPNLCHFLLDHITRLALYRRAGVDTGAATVIGPQPEAAFQQRILQRAGVDPARVIGTRQAARVRVGRLWVSTSCRALCHAADLGADWAAGFAREILGGQGKRGWRRLYISRGDVPSRRVINEAEVIKLLEPYGFEAIQPGTMPYDQQVAAFRQASHVIGAHGAALTHIVVCPPGAHVLEMFHPLYGMASFAMQAEGARLNYTAMLARDFQHETPEWNNPDLEAALGSRYLSRHMRVDLNVLRAYLDSVL